MDSSKIRNSASAIRLFIIDTLAVNLFFFVVNFANETLVARMPLGASLRLRAVAVITNTLTARPYGMWRDYLAKNFGKGFWALYILDSLVFFTFQLPLYWMNMAVAGKVTFSQMTTASLSIGAMAGLLGRPCGLFLTAIRKLFWTDEQAHNGEQL